MARDLKGIKVQKHIIDEISKGRRVATVQNTNFYGTNCFLRRIDNFYLNQEFFSNVNFNLADQDDYMLVETKTEFKHISMSNRKINLIMLKTDGNKYALVDNKLLKFFDKNAQLYIINERSAIRVYEGGKLTGIIMPFLSKSAED